MPNQLVVLVFRNAAAEMIDCNDKYKNGHILPTGQWYAPSAVINDAFIMPEYARACKSMPESEEYARICQGMQEYTRVCQSMPEYARVCQSMQ